jgi:hypothetical protein
MAKRPGDFSKATVDNLMKRAGQICSNPACRRSTSMGHTDKDKSVIVGQACHIYGEAPGSKRYNPVMSDEQRSDSDNAIWLCGLCHKMIDSDENKYPIGLLIKWKDEHENENRIIEKNKTEATKKPLLDISLTGSHGSSRGHFRVFTIKNISNEVAFDLDYYIKGFGYYWKPVEYGNNQIMLEPQKSKDNIEYQMTISDSGLPPEKIPELYFYVQYKNVDGYTFQIKREILQKPVPTNIYNDFTMGNFVPPKQIFNTIEVNFIQLLDYNGGGRNGLFRIGGESGETVVFGICNTLLATWELSNDMKYTEEAIRELGIIEIKKMVEENRVKDTMLTAFEVPNELQPGFENYKKFRDSL